MREHTILACLNNRDKFDALVAEKIGTNIFGVELTPDVVGHYLAELHQKHGLTYLRVIEYIGAQTPEDELKDLVEAAGQAEVQLDPEQTWAAETVMDPRVPVCVLTGAAGTGKSTIIKHLVKSGRVTVCATTGKAALNVEGCTVDTLFNFSRDTWTFRDHKRLEKNMAGCANTILIDEASMIGAQMARLINDAATLFNKRIILVGDWGQARPVKDMWPMYSALFANAQLIKLTKCHRQNEGPYLAALNRLRVGQMTPEDHALFETRVVAEQPPRDFPGFCMFATNKATDAYNKKCLAEHCAEHNVDHFTFETEFEDTRSDYLKSNYPLDEKRIAKIIDDGSFAHDEDFAVGCKVVITRNIDDVVVNGDVGKLVDIDTKTFSIAVEVQRRGYSFVVRLDKGTQEVVDAAGAAQARLHGYPIRLGYGVTIHKSQGMTVDSAWVDMASICHHPVGGRHGLAYVALSRTRTLEGLMISKWTPEALEVDNDVRAWL